MKAVLLRTGSIQSQSHISSGIASPQLSLPRCNSVTGIFSGEKSSIVSQKISLHLDFNGCRISGRGTPIRRAFSETDMMRSETEILGRFPARILEDESLELSYCSSALVEELGFSSNGGDGFGKGKRSGGGGKNGGDDHGGADDLQKIHEYYKEMLKSNPGDSLLLRNYGKFLHEVEGDVEKAEEYYGRAILANPDGEVLSLYGKLIWDKQRDGERAKSYFDQAVSASPHDCMVMGSYAHFMWEAEEDDEDEPEEINIQTHVSPAMVSLL